MDLGALPIFYFYKDELKASPTKIALIQGISMLPWCIKPIFGFITDNFPIFGYKRKSYLILVSMIELMGFIYMGTLANTIQTVAIIQTM